MKNVNNYYLSASLVCADMLNLGRTIKTLQKGNIDYIHFDVMDGVFVPRFGLHPEILHQLKKITDIPVDVHMMSVDAEKYIEDFARAGAQIYCVHAEATQHLHRTVMQIKKHNMMAGVVLNPGTPLSVLDYILEDIDLVMLMAINPGIVGHKIITSMYKKVADLKKKLAKYPNIMIEIDGGVTPETASVWIEKGASILVCGTSTIFQPPDPIDVKIKELRKKISNKYK